MSTGLFLTLCSSCGVFSRTTRCMITWNCRCAVIQSPASVWEISICYQEIINSLQWGQSANQTRMNLDKYILHLA